MLRAAIVVFTDGSQAVPERALALLNAAVSDFGISEASCAAELQRTCISSLDDAALCQLVTTFCGSSSQPQPTLASAIVSSILVQRVFELVNPVSRQLFSAIACLVHQICCCIDCFFLPIAR
jgi:hypothetical protein